MRQKVEDVSIHQVSKSSDDWKKFDVRAEPVLDVKSCLHHGPGSRDPYVESYKEVNGRNVAIAGVAAELWRQPHEQVFLGTVTIDDVNLIKKVVNAYQAKIGKSS